jgi:hypothetical protein
MAPMCQLGADTDRSATLTKLPAPVPELDIPDPLPHLTGTWTERYNEWGWQVPDKSSVPDAGPIVDLIEQASASP